MVEGVLCRALLDIGAGSSYASAALIQAIAKPSRSKEIRRIEMMHGSTMREVEIFTITVQAIDSSVDVKKVENWELL